MNKKNLLAGLLSLCMTLSLLPARAHAALIKLPAPASVEILTENRNPIGEWGWEFRKGEVLVTGIPRSLPDIKVKVICLDTGEVIDECSNIISDFEGGLVELDAMSFPFGDHFEDPMPSGRYVAEAYFVGDNEKYADSDVVRSIPYIFQDPGKRYEAPKNLHWVDNTPPVYSRGCS